MLLIKYKKNNVIDYNIYFASIWAGVSKEDLKIKNTSLIPIAFLNYNLFHQSQIKDDNKELFNKTIQKLNADFLSFNIGLDLKHKFNDNYDFNIYTFYEKRLIGKDFKTEASFDDFNNRHFTQIHENLNNFIYYGLNFNYNKNNFYLSFGAKLQQVLKDEHKNISTNLKIGLDF